MKEKWLWAPVAICFATTAALPALGIEELPSINGVYGMESVGTGAWLAVLVDISQGEALSGMTWYNNDELSIVPRLMVGTGYAEGPGPLSEFVNVATGVTGGSSAWSDVTFDIPVAASLGRLYVVFELPLDSPLAARGLGGGPGVGYSTGTLGCPGWLSGDGEAWAALHTEYRFAILPNLIPYTEGMEVKSLDGGRGEVRPAVTEPYLRISPNPFNPQTEISFGLSRDSGVTIEIFDLRGRRVFRMQESLLVAGEHRLTWNGRSTAGEGLASGIYFVQLKSSGTSLTQRLVLVR